MRAGRRGGPGDDGPVGPDRLLERRPGHDGGPRVGQDRGGSGAGSPARGHRSPAEPHGGPVRLARRSTDRHRCRARARPHARARPGRAGGSRLSRAPDGRVRSARAGRPAPVRPGAGRFHHRAAARRHRAPRPSLRPRAGAVHPDRVRHVSEQPGRPGHAGGRLPARRRRRLREAGRRRPAGDRRRIRLLLRGGAPAVGAGRDAAGQPLAAGAGAPRDARPADTGPLRLGQQPGRHVPGRRDRPPGAHARGSLHGRSRPVPHRHRSLCRSGAAGDDVPRDRGPLPGVRGLLRAVRPAGGAGSGRGVVQREARSGAGPTARGRRRGLLDDHAGAGPRRLRRRDWARREPRSRRAPDRRPGQDRPLSGRSAIPDAVGEARVLLGDPRGRGAAAHAGLARGCRGDEAGAPVAASPAHGARDTFRATRPSRATAPSGVAKARRS